MEKKSLLTMWVGIALAFLLATPAFSQPIKLSLAYQNAPGAWGSVNGLQPWVKKVEEATKGKVKIDVYYNQTLVKAVDTWNAVKTGVADIGWCFHGYWPDMTPLADVVTLPSLPMENDEKLSEVLWKLYEKYPEIQGHFKDVHVLFLWTGTQTLIITRNKQVKTMEDLKGLKIRIPGGPATEYMKALGAIPVLMPMPDSYQALEKGVMDGMGSPWEAVESVRLYEVVKYYTAVPLTGTVFSMAVNPRKWNSLPKDVQDAITSVSGLEGAKHWGRGFFDSARGNVLETVKKRGHEMVLYTVPPGELKRWTDTAGIPIWKGWVKKMEGKGYANAQQILDTTLELLKK